MPLPEYLSEFLSELNRRFYEDLEYQVAIWGITLGVP